MAHQFRPDGISPPSHGSHATEFTERGKGENYGNAVYKRLRPGLIYVFKIGNDGQVYPETVLDM